MLINQWQKSDSYFRYKGIIHFYVVTVVWAFKELGMIVTILDDQLIWIYELYTEY